MDRDEYNMAYRRAEHEVRFKRLGPGSYAAHHGPRVIAEIDKTGTHLDHYPWDVAVTFPVEPREGGRLRPSTSACDTYRACKEFVLDAWVYRTAEAIA